MKNSKIALSLTAALLLSTSVYATNTIDVEVGVQAYIATGLGVAVENNLEFGAVVQPTGDDSPATVTISCIGDPTYSGFASAAGPGNVGQNATGAAVTPNNGLINVTGESDYSITVAVTTSPTLPSGVDFMPRIFDSSQCGNVGAELASTYQGQLDDEGNLQLSLFGELSVDGTFDSDRTIDATAVLTISYR